MSEVTAVPLRPIKRSALIALWIGIGLLVVIGIGTAWAGTEKQVRMAMSPAEFLAANARHSGVKQTASGLQYEVLQEGTGPRATASDLVMLDYEGRLRDGTIFDSTAKSGQPAMLPADPNQMIHGFAEGLQLMNRGSKYRFWIPPDLGYGAREQRDPRTGVVAIPGDAVLIFDVTAREIVPASSLGGMGGMGAAPHGEVR